MDKTKLDNHFEIKQTVATVTIKLIVMQIVFSFLSLLTSLAGDTISLFNNGKFISNTIYDSFTFTVFIFLQLIFTIFILLQWSFEKYIIYEDKIVHKKGYFSKQTYSYSLKDIRSASITEGLVGKLFNYGSITLHSPTLTEDIVLYNVMSPALVIAVIDNKLSFLNKAEIVFMKPTQ